MNPHQLQAIRYHGDGTMDLIDTGRNESISEGKPIIRNQKVSEIDRFSAVVFV